MTNLPDLLDRLWQDYLHLNPHAGKVHARLEQRGEQVKNDHIAFRTWDDPRVNIGALAATFTDAGYKPRGEYTFPTKKLNARHYEHENPDWPKIFISELRVGEFSEPFQALVRKLIDQIPADALQGGSFPFVTRPWALTAAEYEQLRGESEYAGWLSALGYRANHFTVSVNALRTFESLEQLNRFIKESGISLNTAGGEIKGSPEAGLEQSSTLAGEVEVSFTDAKRTIPACYYEFARRHPLPTGELFSGFIVQSADKIFQSTDRREGRGGKPYIYRRRSNDREVSKMEGELEKVLQKLDEIHEDISEESGYSLMRIDLQDSPKVYRITANASGLLYIARRALYLAMDQIDGDYRIIDEADMATHCDKRFVLAFDRADWEKGLVEWPPPGATP